MGDIEELRRTYTKVAAFDDFRADQRIWWIYMRNAAIELVSRADYPGLHAACEYLKAFPENIPNERARWMALFEAAAEVLEGSEH